MHHQFKEDVLPSPFTDPQYSIENLCHPRYKPFVWSLHPPSLTPFLLSRFCVSSLSLFPVIYLPSEEAAGLRSLLGYDSSRGEVSRGECRGWRLWTNPPRVPSLLQSTYLTKPRMHGPRELQPLCMIIENPGDTSQPHSRVIYYYFVSITSERTSRVGRVSIYSWQYFDELCWLILARPENEILLLGFPGVAQECLTRDQESLLLNSVLLWVSRFDVWRGEGEGLNVIHNSSEIERRLLLRVKKCTCMYLGLHLLQLVAVE